MSYHPPESEYLEPSVYFHLGMAFARLLDQFPKPAKGGSVEEYMKAGVTLMFEIASGKTTLTSPPDEEISFFRSQAMDTDALKNSVREGFSRRVAEQKLAAVHLIREIGWLDCLDTKET